MFIAASNDGPSCSGCYQHIESDLAAIRGVNLDALSRSNQISSRACAQSPNNRLVGWVRSRVENDGLCARACAIRTRNLNRDQKWRGRIILIKDSTCILWQICKLHKTLLSGLANEKLLMMVSTH